MCQTFLDKKRVSLVCIDREKSDIAAILELNPGISMIHRYPANRKTGSPFVPPGETNFWNWPLWPKDYYVLAAYYVVLYVTCGKEEVNQHK